MLSRTHTHKPPRTRICVGCRETDLKAALLRVVALGDELVIDLGHNHIGRAAYIHSDALCVRAASLGGLARTFHTR